MSDSTPLSEISDHNTPAAEPSFTREQFNFVKDLIVKKGGWRRTTTSDFQATRLSAVKKLLKSADDGTRGVHAVVNGILKSKGILRDICQELFDTDCRGQGGDGEKFGGTTLHSFFAHVVIGKDANAQRAPSSMPTSLLTVGFLRNQSLLYLDAERKLGLQLQQAEADTDQSLASLAASSTAAKALNLLVLNRDEERATTQSNMIKINFARFSRGAEAVRAEAAAAALDDALSRRLGRVQRRGRRWRCGRH